MRATAGEYRITSYQAFVFAIAGGAWLFDNIDQRMFSLARIPALSSLMGMPGGDPLVQAQGKIVTAVFLIGWGLGGVILGPLGDRFGRSRLLTVSVLLYAVGTGLTGLSITVGQFTGWRFLTGLGIGGVFGLAVAIIAETFTSGLRVAMLAGLQMLSPIGNISAALVKIGADGLATQGVIAADQVWRWLFALGALPALMAVASGLYLRESDAWLELRAQAKLPRGWFGAYGELFSNRDERRGLIIGTLLASAGVVGLWAIGEYAVDLQEAVFTTYFRGVDPPAAVAAHVSAAKNQAYLLQMIGGAAGMIAFSWAATRLGRRPAFIGGFVAALVLTLLTYGWLKTPADADWMLPLMGAAQLSVFAGFSIYLPELFGPRARGTGVSFCYNVGRFAAAIGSLVSAALTTVVFKAFPSPLPLRYAAMTMCAVFVVGIGAAIMAPETKGAAPRG